jgi:glycosyltransferase involved in cell wall biosynthesis
MSLRFAQIVVCRNQAGELPRALDSVLSQSILPDEIIVGDDGSSDDSPEVIEDYARRHPKRVRPLLSAKRRGIGANLNACVLASGSDLVSVLAADDEILPGKLEAQLAAVRRDFPAYEVFHSAYRLYIEDTGHVRTWTNGGREGRLFLPIAQRRFRMRNMLFSRRLYDEIGGFDERLPLYEDWKFHLELALRTQFRCVPGVFSVYRQHPAGAHRRPWSEHRDCVARVCEDVVRRHGLLRRERRALEATRWHFEWRARGPAAVGALLRCWARDPAWIGSHARLAAGTLRQRLRRQPRAARARA